MSEMDGVVGLVEVVVFEELVVELVVLVVRTREVVDVELEVDEVDELDEVVEVEDVVRVVPVEPGTGIPA